MADQYEKHRTAPRLPFVAPLPPGDCPTCAARPIATSASLLDVVDRLARDITEADKLGVDFISCFEIEDARELLDAMRRGVRPVRS